jgi:hypothetical protein
VSEQGPAKLSVVIEQIGIVAPEHLGQVELKVNDAPIEKKDWNFPLASSGWNDPRIVSSLRVILIKRSLITFNPWRTKCPNGGQTGFAQYHLTSFYF